MDGHSTDNTVAVARQLRPSLSVLYQPGKGKGKALRYGVEQARGDIVVALDADGETDPEDIPRFVEPLPTGYEFAKGSRLAGGRPPKMPCHRWLGNRVLAITSNILFGSKYTDVCSGYNAFWKTAFLRLNLTYDGFKMEQEMAIKVKKAGLRVIEVSHHDAGRIAGASKTADIDQVFVDWHIMNRERFHG